MINRVMVRPMLIVAASLAMCAGTAPTQACDGGSRAGEKSAQGEAGKSRLARRTCERLKRDMGRLAERKSSGLREAARAGIDALEGLADSGSASAEDVDAVDKAMQGAMGEALAAAMAEVNAMGEKYLASLVANGASEAMLAKAKQMIERADERLKARAARYLERFAERMDELFPDADSPTDDSPDDESSGGCDGAGGAA